MDINYNELEKLYLTEEEINFIKYTLINLDISSPETRKMFSWRGTIDYNVLSGKTQNPKEIEQCERLREITFLFEILKDSYCHDIIEYSRNMDIMDTKEKEFNAKLMIENTAFEIEKEFDRNILEQLLEEVYDQDLNEPYIQNLIQELMHSKLEEDKFKKLKRLIEAADFKYIDSKTILSIAVLVLKEYNQAEKNNKKLYLQRKHVEKPELIFLVLNGLKNNPIILGDNPQNKKNKK